MHGRFSIIGGQVPGLPTKSTPMTAGLMKKVLSVNRSWTPDSYFSLRKPIHRGRIWEKCPDGISGYRNKEMQISCFVPGRKIPQQRNYLGHNLLTLLIILVFNNEWL